MSQPHDCPDENEEDRTHLPRPPLEEEAALPASSQPADHKLFKNQVREVSAAEVESDRTRAELVPSRRAQEAIKGIAEEQLRHRTEEVAPKVKRDVRRRRSCGVPALLLFVVASLLALNLLPALATAYLLWTHAAGSARGSSERPMGEIRHPTEELVIAERSGTVDSAQAGGPSIANPPLAKSPPSGLDSQPATNNAGPAEPHVTESQEDIDSVFKALRDTLEARRNETSALRREITAIRMELDAEAKTLKEMRDNLNGQAIADKVSNQVSRELSGVGDMVRAESQRVERQLSGLATKIGVLQREVAAQREARPEDVALVVFHSARLDGRLFVNVFQRIFLEDNYRFSFGKYRLSLCRAANGQLESIPVNLEPDDKNPVLPRQLEFPEPDRSSTEDSQGLDPGKVLSPGTSPGRRRIVMIVSSEAQPPKSDDPRWKDVQRYAILVDTTGSQKERQGGTSDNLSKWEEFCIGRSKDKAGTTLTGEASLISVKGGPQHALPPETEREFERILRWYIRPLR